MIQGQLLRREVLCWWRVQFILGVKSRAKLPDYRICDWVLVLLLGEQHQVSWGGNYNDVVNFSLSCVSKSILSSVVIVPECTSFISSRIGTWFLSRHRSECGRNKPKYSPFVSIPFQDQNTEGAWIWRWASFIHLFHSYVTKKQKTHSNVINHI